MKIRAGFVSNSSSSSFMVGIAIIEDEKKFNKLKEKYGEIAVFDPDNYNSYEIQKKGDTVLVETPVNYSTTLSVKPADKKVAYFSIGNDEGDSCFYEDDGSDWPELNYDIDLDFFNERQINLYEDFSEKNGLSNIDKIYGAGRNG
jgi:hypothetical protein